MKDLEERLRDRLQQERDVLVAYLFGSQARGTSGPLSDVDVAVLLREGDEPFRRKLELIAVVSEVVGSKQADVVVLNEAPVALGYRVLRDGRILFSRDESARVRYHARTVDRYLDMAPMRQMYEEGLRHRLEEGSFGRR